MIWTTMFEASLPRALLLLLLAFPSPTLQRSSLDPVKQLDPQDPSSHLSKILIPRVPDTANNTLVRNYIIEKLEELKWHVEQDAFDDQTPFGTKHFVNIIATKDPKAARRVIVAAHFDSKYFPEPNRFVGATDSAAPCALMLDLAETLNPLLDERAHRLEAGMEEDEEVSDTTLQLVFFDGEEAFVSWTDTDSIYGARAEHPLIRSYTLDTAWFEKRLGESGAFAYGDEQGMAPEKWKSFFYQRTTADKNLGGIGDDHIPFVQRGVDILHLITSPFPTVWHTVRDDGSALHMPTMRRWNIMFRVFMSEYLNLRPDEKKSRSETAATAVERSDTELGTLEQH
ncbi:hypothetical protein K438DRAFT_1818565 [Mycena galopus ATCC 62051]|nr:hypothetical protein K438DRAFT_1818565 [Mycena galopus ATCC 62051]